MYIDTDISVRNCVNLTKLLLKNTCLKNYSLKKPYQIKIQNLILKLKITIKIEACMLRD